MGKIEKEKLLEEFRGIGSMYLSDVRRVIKNFLEEQEIDFDALWKEYEEKYSCKKTANCDNCTYPNKLYYTTICFVDFLKSKNLTVPKLVEIPVKKTWTLKKEYQEYHLKMCIGTMVDVKVDEEPKYPKYYDLTETPDYSQVKVGDAVEVYHNFSNKPNYGIVQKNSDNMLSITGNINSINAFCINYSHIKSLTILKAAE